MALTVSMSNQSLYSQTAEQNNEEMALVRAAQQDPRHFEPLYTKYYKRIAGYVYHRVEDKETAYEITAEVFYKALERLPQFRPMGVPFGAWLFRIAFNEINLWYRKKKRQRTVYFDAEGISELKTSLEPPDEARGDEQLYEALQELSEEEMEMIDLRYFEKRPFGEICEITGLNESACKMRVYRAIEKLKKYFEKD